MISATLTGPTGDQFNLDTPDPNMLGTWLEALFRYFQIKYPSPGGLQFA